MKIIAAFLCLVFASSLLHAQVSPANPKTAPGKTGVKAEAPLPKIPGITIVRPNGNLLGLEVVEGKFKLTFYDKKHKPMAMDVTRATARWPDKRASGDSRTVLNGTGTALVGAKYVNPPYAFNVYLTLLQGEGDEAKAVENYTVQLRG